ncbi:MAG: hypothetical protein JSV89_00430 [Spirochaetaceae bacterium]|nr:MAG: hypothetical protein JSV89_00430 [Spirochaetaceae bacterium]
MSTKIRKSTLWDPVALKEDILYQGEFSTLTVWLRRSGRDWFLASTRPEGKTDPAPLHEVKATELPNQASFSRWVVGDDSQTVQFVPTMPDRPIVVRPVVNLKVPTGQDARFFFAIPVWVRVVARPADGITLCELPSLILSNTWFGRPAAGELCYALQIEAAGSLEELEDRPCMAICPVTIRNQAPKELDFARLCVRVEHLDVFSDRERLWTNEIEVRFAGEEQSSQVTVGRGAPPYTENAEKLCNARQPVEKTFLQQSFSFLRSLTGI